MSLARLVFYSAILAGWAAFIAWSVAEGAVLDRFPANIEVAVVGAILGGAIGGAVNGAAALGGGALSASLQRSLPGLLGGACGGAVGAAIGNVLFSFVPGGFLGWIVRGLGWMLMGMGIGMIDGLLDRSGPKVRNGLLGGALGGLLGGLLFDPLQSLVSSGTGMSSRATAFVILGLAIGACIGLAQVVLREAWLTVVDGYRPGRQIILRPLTTLGRAEHLPLPFIGAMNSALAPEQVTIEQRSDGGFLLHDHGGGPRTTVNHQPTSGAVPLRDGDLIRLGPNVIRFNQRRGSKESLHPNKVSQAVAPPPPPPRAPPVRPTAPKGSVSPSPKTRTAVETKQLQPNSAPQRGGSSPSPPPPPPPPPRKPS